VQFTCIGLQNDNSGLFTLLHMATTLINWCGHIEYTTNSTTKSKV